MSRLLEGDEQKVAAVNWASTQKNLLELKVRQAHPLARQIMNFNAAFLKPNVPTGILASG